MSTPTTPTNSDKTQSKGDSGTSRIDAVKVVGILCAAYIAIFTINYASNGAYTTFWETTDIASYPPEIIGLLASLIIIVTGFVANQRILSIFGWIAASLIAFPLFHLESFTTQNLESIGFLSLALGLPFLILLEIILTIESGTARARVIFRPMPFTKTLVLTAAILVGFLLSFSYVGMLQTYSTGPEAATFQTAMIAGLSTIILATIIFARPRRRPTT